VRRICVFSGSSTGTNAAHRRTTIALAQVLAARRLELVYGGGCVGLMGVLADAMLAAGGRVIGVIPRTLMQREVGHRGLTELKVVEMFEALTWAQLGVHSHPCGVLNSDGFFDALFAYLDRAVAEGFVRAEHRTMWLADDDPGRLLDRFADYRAPVIEKWLASDRRP